MIFKNYSQLATSPTRKIALEIASAGIEACLTPNIMRNSISLKGSILSIKGKHFNLKNYKNIYVIGGGKAAADMAIEIERILGKRITKGIVTDVRSKPLQHIKVVKGSHPLPSQININAVKVMEDIVQRAQSDDLIIALFSGGGSALLEYPRVTLPELIAENKALLKSGANIYEMNIVRKHMSLIKGGWLSIQAYPATLVVLEFSDVLGDDMHIIASGPTLMDTCSLKDVERIVKRYKLPHLPFKEIPKDRKLFSTTHNILLLTNHTAVEAMVKKAKSYGLKTKVLGYQLHGEAREVGRTLAKKIQSGAALIAAGETTVTVHGNGKGGRNQELALGAFGAIRKGVVLSCGTDGIDNSPAAGAIADEKSLAKAKKLGLDPKRCLAQNNSYPFFQKMKDLLMIGPTGTNVADIMMALDI